MDKQRPRIIVTGAAGGLGSVAVKMLRDRDCNVVCVDREQNAVDQLIGSQSGKGDAIGVAADLGLAADAQRMIDAATQKWGGIDGLFLTASILGTPGLVHTQSDQNFDDIFRNNVRSIWLSMKLAIPVMLNGGGGSIVTVGSVASLRGNPNLAAYAASKHAVLGLTRSVALEYVTQGIRANTLCPGAMDTPQVRAMFAVRGNGDPSKGRAETVAKIPAGRMAYASELGSTAVWLLLDAPEHLTGQDISVDGARTAA
jgi:NAD(P)-dependent dehydrogenase (short-subunit alcohol dehydrogenase family)